MEQKPVSSTRSDDLAEDLNSAHIAAQQFDQAAAHLKQMKHGLIDFLKRPARTVILEFPVELADGSVRSFTGYRVLHSQVRGPGKGGIRYHPAVTLDEVRAAGGVDELEVRLSSTFPSAGPRAA